VAYRSVVGSIKGVRGKLTSAGQQAMESATGDIAIVQHRPKTIDAALLTVQEHADRFLAHGWADTPGLERAKKVVADIGRRTLAEMSREELVDLNDVLEGIVKRDAMERMLNASLQRTSMDTAIKEAASPFSMDPIKRLKKPEVAGVEGKEHGAFRRFLDDDQDQWLTEVGRVFKPDTMGHHIFWELPAAAKNKSLAYERAEWRAVQAEIAEAKITPAMLKEMLANKREIPVMGNYADGAPVGSLAVTDSQLMHIMLGLRRHSTAQAVTHAGMVLTRGGRAMKLTREDMDMLVNMAQSTPRVQAMVDIAARSYARQTPVIEAQHERLTTKAVPGKEENYSPRTRDEGYREQELANPYSRMGVPEPGAPGFLEPSTSGGDAPVLFDGGLESLARFTTTAGNYIGHPESQWIARDALLQNSSVMTELKKAVGVGEAMRFRRDALRALDANVGVVKGTEPGSIEEASGRIVKNVHKAYVSGPQFGLLQAAGGTMNLTSQAPYADVLNAIGKGTPETQAEVAAVLEESPRLWRRVTAPISERLTAGAREGKTAEMYGIASDSKLMFLISAGDKAACNAAIRAALMYAERLGLTGADKVRAAALEAERLVWETQNVTDALARTGLQHHAATGPGLSRFVTMFTSENAAKRGMWSRARIKYARTGDKAAFAKAVTPIVTDALLAAGIKLGWDFLITNTVAGLVALVSGEEFKVRWPSTLKLLDKTVQSILGIWIGAGQAVYATAKAGVQAAGGSTRPGKFAVEGILTGTLGSMEADLGQMLDSVAGIINAGGAYKGGPAKGMDKATGVWLRAIESALNLAGPLIGVPSSELNRVLRGVRQALPAEIAKRKAQEEKDRKAGNGPSKVGLPDMGVRRQPGANPAATEDRLKKFLAQ